MPEEKKPLNLHDVAAQFREHFNAEMAKQVNEYDGKELAKHIIETLNKDRHMVIWRLLGLTDHWGKFEVDHCNGRNSPIVKMMTEAVRAEVQQWLQESIREVIAANRPKLKAQFRKAFEAEISERSRWETRSCAEHAVKNIMDDIRREVEKEFKEGVRNADCETTERKSPAGETHPQAREPGQA